MKKQFSRLDAPSLSSAQLLERHDLQECIYNSSDAFFAEIDDHIFLIGKEITPSQTVQDRIDLLGMDPEGCTVIVELKRGSNKLQMFQAISYAGMVARWGPQDFRNLLSDDAWEQLTDFLEVDIEEINRRQRLLLVAEGYDYALLAGAEWLSDKHGVDIRCSSVTLATDQSTGAEYLACTSTFPPPALAEQAAVRSRSSRRSSPPKWSDWDEALSHIENDALRAFAEKELERGRENYLHKRSLHYRIGNKRRLSLGLRNEHGYVWHRGRFPDDRSFWKSRLSDPDSVKPAKKGRSLRFNLCTEEDLRNFRQAATSELVEDRWHGTRLDGVLNESE